MKKKSVVYKYNYYDSAGTRRCKSFTAPTMKQARLKAAQWEIDHPQRSSDSTPIYDAVEAYIEMQTPVLSPSTVRAYKSILKHRIPAIGDIKLKDIGADTVQNWINGMVFDKLSPKTVRNCYALLMASIHAKDRRTVLDVKLPQPERYIGHTPSDDEVKAILEYAKQTGRRDLYIAILLAAFGPLRRSEVCALTSDDVRGNEITVSKDVVKDDLGMWHVKTTKTQKSTRVISYPDFVIDEIKGIKGQLVSCNPDQLHMRFRRALEASGSPHFRFHDLRHYGASIMHALGVPDIYIMERGGWSTDYVMKRVYINAMDEEKRRQTDKINSHFERFGT